MHPPARPARRLIRASEIGQYRYCARAWWLGSVEGVPSTNTAELARGDSAHARHGRGVWLARALRIAGAALALAAALLVLISLLR